jgi:hypothetical protein
MSRIRVYPDNAARQRAYRKRQHRTKSVQPHTAQANLPSDVLQRRVIERITEIMKACRDDRKALLEIQEFWSHLPAETWEALVLAMIAIRDERVKRLGYEPYKHVNPQHPYKEPYETWLRAQWQTMVDRFGLWPEAYEYLHGWLGDKNLSGTGRNVYHPKSLYRNAT